MGTFIHFAHLFDTIPRCPHPRVCPKVFPCADPIDPTYNRPQRFGVKRLHHKRQLTISTSTLLPMAAAMFMKIDVLKFRLPEKGFRTSIFGPNLYRNHSRRMKIDVDFLSRYFRKRFFIKTNISTFIYDRRGSIADFYLSGV